MSTNLKVVSTQYFVGYTWLILGLPCFIFAILLRFGSPHEPVMDLYVQFAALGFVFMAGTSSVGKYVIKLSSKVNWLRIFGMALALIVLILSYFNVSQQFDWIGVICKLIISVVTVLIGLLSIHKTFQYENYGTLIGLFRCYFGVVSYIFGLVLTYNMYLLSLMIFA